MPTTQASAPASAPPWTLLAAEPVRAALEYARMHQMQRARLPTGDGHAVVFFPGLAADHRSLGPLKNFCDKLGYATLDWGRGLNTGPRGDVDAWIDELASDVDALIRPHGKPVSLIGWSLGGIYAREVAKKLERRVRQVITIGTPISATPAQTHVSWLYRLVNGRKPVLDEALMARLRTAPAVATTSIYSRSDGVVAWQTCLQEATLGHSENIEVAGSHCGLGWNPEVLSIIAHRLRQPGAGQRRHRVPRQRRARQPRDVTLGACR
jgi:pimeloyl-ACP methyl ester carboxylesterase